jgi:hypothetical protein
MSNQITMRSRISAVAAQLENGVSSSEIIHEFTTLWDVSQSSVKTYIALARDIIMERMDNRDTMIEAVRAVQVAEAAEKHLRSAMELEGKLVEIMEKGLSLVSVKEAPNGITTEKKTTRDRDAIHCVEIIFKKRGYLNKAAKPNASSSLTGDKPVNKTPLSPQTAGSSETSEPQTPPSGGLGATPADQEILDRIAKMD